MAALASVSASASAIAWATATDKRIETATDPASLRNFAAQADRCCLNEGLSARAQAELHLTATAAYGKLAKLHVDQTGNGMKGFRELQKAVTLSPDDPEVASSYGRALLILSHLSWMIRFFATRALGIDLQAEMKRDLTMLGANPGNPLCQALRQEIAHHLGDAAAEADARQKLARLAATDPVGVAEAQAKIASDTSSAKTIKKS